MVEYTYNQTTMEHNIMTNYIAQINLTNIRILDTDTAAAVAESFDRKIGQTGISYQSDGEVVFTSTSALDVIQTLSKKHWTHSKRPSRLKSGDRVYIMTNSAESTNYGQIIMVEATATGPAVMVDDNDWASNGIV